MPTLIIDIETRPHLGYIWGLWDQNVGLSQLVETTEMLCFAAKWYGQKDIQFYSVHKDGKQGMLDAAHSLLDQAAVVVHFNGRSFDIPHINREFVTNGYSPPSPYAQVDLLKVVKKQFRFASNKLAYVTKTLGLQGKLDTGGFDLWLQVMAGDEKAWDKFARYNKQDVKVTEQAYVKLLPWIQGHPNINLFTGGNGCPKCGSPDVQKRGFAYTPLGVFQQVRCNKCGSWSRGKERIGGADLRPVTS